MTIITISGLPGAGKTTVGKKLAEKLGYEFYSMGNLRRKMALNRGITIQELNELGETEAWTDKDVDDYQKNLGEKKDNFIFEGRLSFYFIPKSIKIFLEVNEKIGAERIFKEKRESEKKGGNLEEMIKINNQRVESDKKRYTKYYGINCYDTSNYDIIINTSDKNAEEITREIIENITPLEQSL